MWREKQTPSTIIYVQTASSDDYMFVFKLCIIFTLKSHKQKIIMNSNTYLYDSKLIECILFLKKRQKVFIAKAASKHPVFILEK
jgi:hypothetical protein